MPLKSVQQNRLISQVQGLCFLLFLHAHLHHRGNVHNHNVYLRVIRRGDVRVHNNNHHGGDVRVHNNHRDGDVRVRNNHRDGDVRVRNIHRDGDVRVHNNHRDGDVHVHNIHHGGDDGAFLPFRHDNVHKCSELQVL